MDEEIVELAPGLYAIGAPSPSAATHVYYLLVADQSIPIPNLAQMFTEVGLTGWFIFTKCPVTDPPTFKAQGRARFPSLNAWPDNKIPRGIVWLPDPDDCSAYDDALVCRQNFPQPGQPQTIVANHIFQWSGFSLLVTTNVNIQIDAAASALELVSVVDTIQIGYNGVSQILKYYSPPDGWQIMLPLLGSSAGSLQFSIGLDLGTMQQAFCCAFSYAYAAQKEYATLSYPLFPPLQPAQPQNYLGFNLRLHPLHHLDSTQTRIALDLLGTSPYAANSRKLQSTYFSTINGASLVFTPVDPAGEPASPPNFDPAAAGFGFCKAQPQSVSPLEATYYLAPVGTFQLTQVTPPTATGRGKPGAPEETRWMCGLFGQEYLELAPGDSIEFISGHPAYAPGFSVGSGTPSGTGAPLSDLFTTSWMKLLPGSMHAYFAQPSSSVYFAAAAGDTYPKAVDSLLNTFEESDPFPIVPYGGVFATAQPPQAGGVAAAAPAIIAAFESSVLSSVRHSKLSVPGRGPVFRSSKPVMAQIPARLKKLTRPSASVLLGEGAPTAVTPQGLLVNLTEAGEWESVLLAQSPDDPNTLLEFRGSNGSGTVSAKLSSMLVQNQLFLVAMRPEPLGRFESYLKISGFHFNLEVGREETLLIFKYNTSLSLRELAEKPSLWADASEFVGDDEAILFAQQRIRDAIATAEHEADIPGRPFTYFNQIVDRASWSGVLALHSAIDGNGMPPDLQILLGGISGQLRAHHFGIETNRVLPSSGGAMAIGHSSLFGLIHYDNPQSGEPSSVATDFAYAVETLTVLFSNSKISQLATSVGLTVNTLFERAVNLTSGTSSPDIPNTLVIKGQYQTQGGVGTVLFSSDTAFVYSFPMPHGATRVIDRMEFTHASLAPIYSTPIASPETGTIVRASFALDGQLWFAPEPFPNSDGLDLFSYGNPGTGGLTFTGLTVYIDFELDVSGSLKPGSESVTLQPDLLTFSPSNETVRAHGLLKSMPLDYSRFWYSKTGLSASSLGALPLNCLQLEGQGATASPGEVGPFPYVTSAPHYALEFDLPLGTLGSLSDIGVGLTAKLLIAWGPSTVVPDNDAAAIFVQLPSVFGGVNGFTLQGILRTTFGDANLLMVDVDEAPVYAILFNNIKFSVLGFSFPPGILIDFLIFAGQPAGAEPINGSNIAWFLAAQPVPKSSQSASLPNSEWPLLETSR